MRTESESDGAWDGTSGALTDELFGAGPLAARYLLAALNQLAKAERIRLPPELVHARRGLMRVSGTGIYGHRPQAYSGHPDIAPGDDAAVSELWIKTADVAEQLGLTQRHCARRAAALEELGLARRVKGRWWIHSDQVQAMTAERATA